MRFNKEYVRTITKKDSNETIIVGNLEPGLYQINVWNAEDEVGCTAYVELIADNIYRYDSAFALTDFDGTVVPASAGLYYPSLLNKSAGLVIATGGLGTPWTSNDYTFLIDIYRIN